MTGGAGVPVPGFLVGVGKRVTIALGAGAGVSAEGWSTPLHSRAGRGGGSRGRTQGGTGPKVRG